MHFIFFRKEKWILFNHVSSLKKKVISQRYFKDEHEIILSRVKDNLEAIYSINIIEGGFCYIFTNLSYDKETIEFCKNNNIKYLNFSFRNMEFNMDLPFNIENCFITNIFPFHNYISILTKENKENFRNNKFLFIKIKLLLIILMINNKKYYHFLLK